MLKMVIVSAIFDPQKWLYDTHTFVALLLRVFFFKDGTYLTTPWFLVSLNSYVHGSLQIYWFHVCFLWISLDYSSGVNLLVVELLYKLNYKHIKYFRASCVLDICTGMDNVVSTRSTYLYCILPKWQAWLNVGGMVKAYILWHRITLYPVFIIYKVSVECSGFRTPLLIFSNHPCGSSLLLIMEFINSPLYEISFPSS